MEVTLSSTSNRESNEVSDGGVPGMGVTLSPIGDQTRSVMVVSRGWRYGGGTIRILSLLQL